MIWYNIFVAYALTIPPPTLPQAHYDATYNAPTTKVLVPEGGNLQQAIDQAGLNTIIELEAGAVWNLSSFESYVLRAKQGRGI